MGDDLEDIKDTMLMIELEGIYAWSPGRADQNLPCTQVHLVHRVPGIDRMIIVWRIKSRKGMETLIADLQQKLDEVWPVALNK